MTLSTHAANNARVNVPDERFRWLVEVYKPKSEVPAFLEIVDIAGLVKCASPSPGGLHSTWIPTQERPSASRSCSVCQPQADVTGQKLLHCEAGLYFLDKTWLP